MHMPLRASELDTPLVVMRAEVIDDGFTKVDGEPAEIGRIHAKRRNLPAAAKIAASQEGSALPAVFVVRRNPFTATLVPGDLLTARDGSYRITAAREDPYYAPGCAVEITTVAAQ